MNRTLFGLHKYLHWVSLILLVHFNPLLKCLPFNAVQMYVWLNSFRSLWKWGSLKLQFQCEQHDDLPSNLWHIWHPRFEHTHFFAWCWCCCCCCWWWWWWWMMNDDDNFLRLSNKDSIVTWIAEKHAHSRPVPVQSPPQEPHLVPPEQTPLRSEVSTTTHIQELVQLLLGWYPLSIGSRSYMILHNVH